MTPLLPDVVYRVTRDRYASTTVDALSGIGGLYDDGRWHSKGQRIVYTGSTSTLCLMERLVHADEWIAERHPDRIMITISLPRVSSTYYTAGELSAHDRDWRQEGNPTCRNLGDAWIRGKTACALMIPSATSPMDYNVLLNPAHGDFSRILSANANLDTSPIVLDERIVTLVAWARTKR